MVDHTAFGHGCEEREESSAIRIEPVRLLNQGEERIGGGVEQNVARYGDVAAAKYPYERHQAFARQHFRGSRVAAQETLVNPIISVP